ncbi:MAG: NUDIX domain-containing protein [Planctomycetales bacterium]
MTAPEETFDVVDAEDRVLYQAPRSRVHAENLLHRAVHIFLFRSDGRFLLHLRSASKDQYPLCYTSSASGHLGTGEDYDSAADRELTEELGITARLQRLVKLPASPETAYEHTVLYQAVSDDIPRPDPAEIASATFVTWEELLGILAREPERFSPPFRLLVEWYRLNRPA